MPKKQTCIAIFVIFRKSAVLADSKKCAVFLIEVNGIFIVPSVLYEYVRKHCSIRYLSELHPQTIGFMFPCKGIDTAENAHKSHTIYRN